MTEPTTLIPRPETRSPWLVAMAVTFVLLAAGFGGLQLLARVASGTVERNSASPPPADRLVIQVRAGDVSFIPSPDGQVHVRTVARSGLAEPEPTSEATAAGLVLDARCGWGWPLVGQCEIDHEVAVPASMPVTVSGGSNDVLARDLTGPLVADSESGDVTLYDLAGPAEVTSSSGDVLGAGLRGGSVRVESGSGDVALDLVDPRAVQVRVDSGDVELTVPGSLRYRVEVRTGSGQEEIGVPSDAGADRSIAVVGGRSDVQLRPGD